MGRTLAARRRRTANSRARSWNTDRVFPERVARALSTGSDADVLAALRGSRDARLICVGFAIATRGLARRARSAAPDDERDDAAHDNDDDDATAIALLIPELDAATRSLEATELGVHAYGVAAPLGTAAAPVGAGAAAAPARASPAAPPPTVAAPSGGAAVVPTPDEARIAAETAARLRAPSRNPSSGPTIVRIAPAEESVVRQMRRFVSDTFAASPEPAPSL